jgi:hypothetical protein
MQLGSSFTYNFQADLYGTSWVLWLGTKTSADHMGIDGTILTIQPSKSISYVRLYVVANNMKDMLADWLDPWSYM